MATDWKAAQGATVPYQRRRDALAQEHARNTAAAAASTPSAPHSPSPFVISTLKTCACGARPRYGFDQHVKYCPAALAAAQPVTAVEVVEAIVTAPVDGAVHFQSIPIPEGCGVREVPAGAQGGDAAETPIVPPATSTKVGAKGDCPKCGRHFAKGLHLHHRACKG